jgi:hypothetical protein
MEQDDGIARHRNIFLGLSSINFPLIALEKGAQLPLPLHLLVLHFTTTQSISLSLLCLTVQQTPE